MRVRFFHDGATSGVTFGLPIVPREGDHVDLEGRSYRVTAVAWVHHEHDDAWEIRVSLKRSSYDLDSL